MKLTKSQDFNINYLSKIIQIDNLTPVPNSDRLVYTLIEGNHIIIGKDDFKLGDIAIYCPTESAISEEFLSYHSLFSNKELNADKTKVGYFNNKGRVRTLKLRQFPSEGVIFALDNLSFYGPIEDIEIGIEFDTINDKIFSKKYVPHIIIPTEQGKKVRKTNKKHVIDSQFKFHYDTELLGKHIDELIPGSKYYVTYKYHGTSGISSNIIVYRYKTWFYKLLQQLGINVTNGKYENIYSSRRVIRNSNKKDVYYYANEILKNHIPEGYTLYYEIVGYNPDNSYIQSGYDYGCIPRLLENEYKILDNFKIYVYRITITNHSDVVYDIPAENIPIWVKKYLPNTVFTPEIMYDDKLEIGHEEALTYFASNFGMEKRCIYCKNNVPMEGLVIHIISENNRHLGKIKAFAFRERESKLLDTETTIIE